MLSKKSNIFLFSFNSGRFREPNKLICDHDSNIFVCDTNNHRIQVFTKEGIFLYFFGREGSKEGQFNYPEGITCDHDGNIVVCDINNHRIQVFTKEGKFMSPSVTSIDSQREYKFLYFFGKYGTEEGQFKYPTEITCDHDGNYVVCDSFNHRIQVFTKKGKFLYFFGKEGLEEGQFKYPKGLTCDHDGNYIVCDTLNCRIQVFKGPSEVPSLLSMCWKQINNN